MAVVKQFDDKTKTLTVEFTTLSSLVEYLKEAETNQAFDGRILSSQKTGDSWSGTKTYDEAIQYLEFGWTAKSKRLADKLRLAKQNQPTTNRRKVFQSVVGYTPVVPNYLMGIPNDMLNSKLTVVKQKVVTLNKDISYNANYSEGEIEDNSIKAYQIIQALEAQGIRCNLNIIFGDDLYSGVNVKHLLVKVRVKGSGEKMNISKTSFSMVNPGMLRRIIFRVIETLPEFKQEDKGITNGYGRAIEARDLKLYVEKQNQYYISRDIRNAAEEAQTFAKKS